MSPDALARTIGLLSLVAVACGSFPLWVESQLIVRGDDAATAANLLEREQLFRLGVVSMLAMNVAYAFAVLAWYQLLRPVSAALALAMLVLIALGFAIGMTVELFQLAALRWAGAADLEAMRLALDLHADGLLVAGIFFGLWLVPLGLLVYRSGFAPRVLGAALVVGSLGYLIRFVQGILFPGAEASLWTNPFAVVTHLAELATALWLLVFGVKTQSS